MKAVTKPLDFSLVENVLITGDLSKLDAKSRSQYYMKVCESLGLNPLTKPFAYIYLGGKLILYPVKDCTDQLRTIRRVSVEELSSDERDGVYIVTAKVRDGNNRTDIATGAVFLQALKGDALANAMMKAETKAKRRATLSICGLGWLDQTEMDTIPDATPASINPETGEIIEAPLKTITSGKRDYPAPKDVSPPAAPSAATSAPVEETPAPTEKPAGAGDFDDENADRDELPDPDVHIENLGNLKAEEGWGALKLFWDNLDEDEQAKWRPILEKRWKPRARQVSQAQR